MKNLFNNYDLLLIIAGFFKALYAQRKPYIFLVYWSFNKIVKEYLWNGFYKIGGFFFKLRIKFYKIF